MRLCLLSVCVSWFVHCDSVSQPLYSVIDAVEKIVKYYEKNYRDLNLDGLFGLRVLEGQLLVIKREVGEGKYQHLPKDQVKKLEEFRLLSSEVCHKAIEFIRKDDEEYYNTMEYVVAYPWTFSVPYRAIEPRLKWDASVYKQSVRAELTESTSDSCMAELTGNVQSKTKGCKVTPKCIHIMTQMGLTHYGITHQLLWTMLAGKAGCHEKVDEMLAKTEFKNMEMLQLEFCTNNFYEMKTLIHGFLNGTITPRYQDLFLEQQFVCANLGFGEFLNLDYMRDILSWQSASGCYGRMKQPKHLPKPVMDKFEGVSSFMDEDYDYADVRPDPKQHHVDQNQINNGVVDMNNNLGHQKPAENPQDELKFPANGVRKSGTPEPRAPANIAMKIKAFTPQPVEGHKSGHQAPSHVINSPVNNALRKLLSVDNTEELISPRLFFQLPNSYQVPVENGPRRRLLVEKEMAGGCLSHKTAVAAGALVMYLRFLIDPGAEVLAMHNADALDNGKKRDILQKPAIRQEPAELPRDEAMVVDKPAQGADGDYPRAKGDVDKLDPYQNGDEGDDDDGANDNEGKDGHNGEDGDDYDGNGGDTYNHEGEAKLGGRNIIHMKKLGKDGGDDGDVYSLGKVAGLGKGIDGGREEYKRELDHTDVEQYPYYDENEDENKLKGRHIRHLPENNGKQLETGNINIPRKDSSFGKPLGHSDTDEYPKRTMVLVFLACFVVLFVFMYRFIKKRRIHIRYYTRTFFNL